MVCEGRPLRRVRANVGAGEESTREKLAAAFLALWSRSRRSPRLALPLLKALDVLFTEGRLCDLPPTHPLPGQLLNEPDFRSLHHMKSGARAQAPFRGADGAQSGMAAAFHSRDIRFVSCADHADCIYQAWEVVGAGELLGLVKGEARGCRDVPTLTWAATALCHLAGSPLPACSGALRALLTLLANRYPKASFHTRANSLAFSPATCCCSIILTLNVSATIYNSGTSSSMRSSCNASFLQC